MEGKGKAEKKEFEKKNQKLKKNFEKQHQKLKKEHAMRVAEVEQKCEAFLKEKVSRFE